MKLTEHIKELETVIIKHTIPAVNIMLGNRAAAFLSTSLLLRLKPIFNIIQSSDAKLSKSSTMAELDNVLNSYVPFNNPDTIVYELYYADKKSIKRLIKMAEKHADLFAFYYIKHLNASIAQMNSTSFIQSHLKSVGSKSNPFEIIATAVDRYTNQLALDILEASECPTGKYYEFLDLPDCANLSEDIAELSGKYADLVSTKIPKWVRKCRLKANSHIEGASPSTQSTGIAAYGYEQGARKESVVVDLSITLNNTISSSCKGTSVGNLFAQTFDSITVDALWFEELTRSLESSIIEKSHQGYSSWSNLSKTKRHLYPSPIRISNDDKLDLIVSIDQSGSVSTADLQKILSIFEQYSESIARVTVMHHTAAVTQQFTLEDAADITNANEFTQALGTRSSEGGTSHLDCFKRIQKLFDKNSNLCSDKVIYLSFSDAYSDIEDVWFKYPIMEQLTTYFIRDSSGRDVNTTITGGQNVIVP